MMPMIFYSGSLVEQNECPDRNAQIFYYVVKNVHHNELH